MPLFHAWETGLTGARDRTTALIRKLRLADLAQIYELLLSAEGEPTGSYLVDIFDKVLQHEIEREAPIIDAAVALNSLTGRTSTTATRRRDSPRSQRWDGAARRSLRPSGTPRGRRRH